MYLGIITVKQIMKQFPGRGRNYLTSLIFLISVISRFAAAGQNLILNGSMTSQKGADVVAPGWVKSYNSPLNTPDINDTAGPLLTTAGINWAGGTPIASPDSGTWQNTYTGEGVKQVINGITVGAIYYFSYYYTSQGITTFPNNISPPNVTIAGASGYENPDYSGTIFQWNSYCGTLIADSASIVIKASGPLNIQAYLAYDGFCLSQTPLAFTQISQQPANISVCDSGAASFRIQAPGSTEYNWEVNNGSGWAYLSNGDPYRGTNTDRLAITNATQSMNNYRYRCYIKGGTCPVYSSSAALTVLPLPVPLLEVNASSPQICSGDSITITAGSGYQAYLWNNSSNTSTITVNQAGDYWVDVTDSNNCSGKDSITILPCEKFYIPNAFTPNGDGINDFFRPVIFGNVINYEFNVYSRWGQLVFQSTDITKGWDGSLNGFNQNSGIFAWNCIFQVEGQKQEDKKGLVVLIR